METVLGTDLRHACTLCVGEGACIYVNMSMCMWVHVCMHVNVCVCVYVCAHVGGCMCTCVWRLEVVGSLPPVLPILCFETESVIGLELTK